MSVRVCVASARRRGLETSSPALFSQFDKKVFTTIPSERRESPSQLNCGAGEWWSRREMEAPKISHALRKRRPATIMVVRISYLRCP
jgi:hypothetical protein